MKSLYLAAVFVAATPLLAQQTGVSHPPDAPIEDTATVHIGDADQANVPVVSAPVVVVTDSSAGQAAVVAPQSSITAQPRVEREDNSPAVTLKHHEVAQFDPDAGVVGEIPQRADELAAGTMFRVRLKRSIETATTQQNTPFTAELTEPVQHMGRVVIPAGSTLEGLVTEIRGGKRFHGAALIHLQAQSIVLPDGTRMPINASVVDTDQYANTRIDEEGNVVRKDHAKETLAIMSLTTGSAAAAGGVIAGIPGALVGAGIGAGVSTVWWLKQDRQTQLPAETLVVMALTTPAPIRSLVREPEYSSAPLRQNARPSGTEYEPTPVANSTVAAQSFVPTN